MVAVADVLPGRNSEVFRKWSSLENEHPPEVCLSVRYEEEGARDQKKKTKRFRTLDLVFEDPARAAVWRAGIAAARHRARADAADPDAAPEKSSSGSHRDTDKPTEDAMSARQTMATAMRVSRAASRFKRLGSGAAAAAGDVSRNKKTNRDVIAEPGDVFVWGRVAAVDGGGAFGAFGNAENAETFDARAKEAAAATPRRVAGTDGIDVVALALGASHVAAVARGRGVYTWGEGRGGRLGHGSHASRALPTKLRGVVVDAAGLGGDGDGDEDGDGDDVQVCCGGSVTFAVSGDGRCSAWGDAEGQSASVFGTGTDSRGARGYGGSAFGSASRWTPVPVLLPGLENGARRLVKSVSASRSHVAALAADGALFVWGENAFGALGVGRSEKEFGFEKEDALSRATPTLVEALRGKRVTSVSCGRWHTAAVADGEVFAWGDAEGGKLGLGALPGSSPGGGEKTARSVFTPARVAGNAFSAPPAHVSCGTWHTLCLTEDGALYVCGAVGGRDVAGSVAETPERVAFAAEDDARDGVPPSDAAYARPFFSRACLLVASGELHAAAVVAAKPKGSPRDVASVYTWGSGKRGALGHGDVLPQKFPKRVAALAGREARRVSCGPDATACVVSPRAATNREKASVAKAGARLTRRFDASARAGMDVRDTYARERHASAYASADRAGLASGLDGAGATARRSSAAELGSLSRVSGGSARSSETREGSVRLGVGRFGGRESDRVFSGVVERANEKERATSEADRRGSFAFATRRPIGAGAKSSDASLADADADAARAAAARARRDAASAAAERDALRLEVASLRAALRRSAERAGDVNAPRPAAPEPAVSEPAVSGRDVPPAPAAALAAAAREEAETLAAFARGGDRDDPTPLAATTRATTPAATRVTTPAATRVTTPAPPVAATATPAAATPRTPQPDGGTPDVGTPETSARASGPGESRRPAPSPSPSPSPSPNPATPGSSSGTPGSQWVEEIEPGVFMTIACDAATGHHVLRRVRFSKRVFSDTEATAWWTKNRARVIRARGLKVNR